MCKHRAEWLKLKAALIIFFKKKYTDLYPSEKSPEVINFLKLEVLKKNFTAKALISDFCMCPENEFSNSFFSIDEQSMLSIKKKFSFFNTSKILKK